MKKIFALLFVILLVISVFAACNNIEQTSASTESTVTTQSTVTTSTSNTTTIATQTTQTTVATTLGYYFEYSVVTSEEPVEIQNKIDKNIHNESIPSKVIITCGKERDVPYMIIGSGRFASPGNPHGTLLDGFGTLGGFETAAKNAIKSNEDSFPVFHCSSLDEISVFLNDSPYGAEVNLINENGEKIEADGPGRYYAYVLVDYVGPRLMYNGKVYFSLNEIHYAAFFIVEITE